MLFFRLYYCYYNNIFAVKSKQNDDPKTIFTSQDTEKDMRPEQENQSYFNIYVTMWEFTMSQAADIMGLIPLRLNFLELKQRDFY